MMSAIATIPKSSGVSSRASMTVLIRPIRRMVQRAAIIHAEPRARSVANDLLIGFSLI